MGTDQRPAKEEENAYDFTITSLMGREDSLMVWVCFFFLVGSMMGQRGVGREGFKKRAGVVMGRKG